MAANRLFVVCQHHATIDEALCLAERIAWEAPYEPGQQLQAREWFQRHQKCGGGKTADHFRLAMHRPPNHDEPVIPVEKAVRLAIVSSNLDAEIKRAADGKPTPQRPFNNTCAYCGGTVGSFHTCPPEPQNGAQNG